MQIIACAGSGKTEVVSQRVADLLASGVDPDQIVAFTFTNRAAESLKTRISQRVEERLGPSFVDRLNGCFVGTIHGYCFELLRRHVPRYETYDILDEHRLAAFLAREANRIGLKGLTGQLFSSLREFISNLNVIDNELIRLADLDAPLRDIVSKFHERLDLYRLLTYGRVITQAVEELATPAVQTRVRATLRHLIVDEYQDINPAQEALIWILAQPPVHLCVVGDDDQSIYQWRGSDVANIVSFEKRYPAVQQFHVTVNRRSRPRIVETANHFAGTIENRIPKVMSPHRDAAPREVVAWSAPTEAQEAETIARTIRRMHEDRGYRYRDIAILVRSSTSYGAILSALAAEGVPVLPAGRSGLFAQSEAQLFGRTTAYLADLPWRSKVFGKGSPVDLEGLAADYAKVLAADVGKRGAIRAHLEAWHQEVVAPTHPANLVRGYYDLLSVCGVAGWDESDPEVAARLGTLARCSAILADYEAVRRRTRPHETDRGQAVGGQDRGHWYYFNLAVFVQNWALGAYEGFEGEENLSLDAVDLTTVHGAKGLEWPVVFVPCCSTSRFPNSHTGQSQKWHVPVHLFDQVRYEGTINDERRLFYVALTRARDWLSVSTHLAVKVNSVDVSPFLLAINGDQNPPPLRGLPLPHPPKGQMASEPPVTITFSDLADFQACGLAYRLRSLIGFQPPLAPELGYGKAVHHILRRVAEQTKAAGRPPTIAELEALFDEAFYLPAASRAAHETMKQSALRLVKAYVQRYGDDLRRTWEVERPFELHLAPDTVIAGRADVILDEEDGVPRALAPVDYKTSVDRVQDHAFQLCIYSDAGQREGLQITRAYIHDLASGQRAEIEVDARSVARAEQRAADLVRRLRARDYRPNPGTQCHQCDVSPICRHRAV